jgi:hypothetical protein
VLAHLFGQGVGGAHLALRQQGPLRFDATMVRAVSRGQISPGQRRAALARLHPYSALRGSG